jgi:hypothetical protein
MLSSLGAESDPGELSPLSPNLIKSLLFDNSAIINLVKSKTLS